MHARPALSALVIVMLIIVARPPDLGYSLQPSTPTLPGTPDPAECTVEPQPVDTLTAMLGTPTIGDDRTSGPTETQVGVIEIPVGPPASADIEAEITAVVYELHACFNAGDMRRAFALVTDTFLHTFAAGNSLTAADLAFFAADPQVVPVELQTTVLAVTDVTVLTRRQVGAFVVTTSPLTGAETVHMTFVRQDDRWLVERVMEFSAE